MTPSQSPEPDLLRVFVSSSVYDQVERLDQIYAIMAGYGYEVWMSHAGTLPLDPTLSAFDACLQGVEKCDIFLGIITGRYGSGIVGDGPSILHQEILRAVDIDKTRFVLVHNDVVIARQLLKQYREPIKKGELPFEDNPILQDIRVLEMYEAAMGSAKPVEERTGNWVQEFSSTDDIHRFLNAQFGDIERVRIFVHGTQENGDSHE
ncbi:MAG: DUF4062 domain-containing protein [Candidatus Fermentibacteria bacterium]|nr:DUF4062 domain-containing protein [Candidatus Fermentibacteria bacterium]